MELKHFRLIKMIAENGNMACTSQKMFLTQSALSHQLKALESELGFKVFNRTRNKWILTEEGEEIHKLAVSILDKLEKGFEKIESIKSGSTGSIKISTECYTFYQGLSQFIQKMGIMYPDIKVDLLLEATHQPIVKMLSNELDIAIVTEKSSNDLLSLTDVKEDEIFALMHKENPLSQHPFIEAHHFTQAHLIIHSFPLDTVSVYQNFLKQNKVKPLKISAVPLTELALEMVSANMGIMCVPKWAMSSFKLSKELKFKRIGQSGLKRNHYIVAKKSDIKKKYIKDFISNFTEEFMNQE